MEKHIELENLLAYTSVDLAEAYFDADEYAQELKNKLKKYKELVNKDVLSEEEQAERAQLRRELSRISKEIVGEIKDKFEEIEMQRKKNG